MHDGTFEEDKCPWKYHYEYPKYWGVGSAEADRYGLCRKLGYSPGTCYTMAAPVCAGATLDTHDLNNTEHEAVMVRAVADKVLVEHVEYFGGNNFEASWTSRIHVLSNSVLESRETALICRGNTLPLSYQGGAAPLHPFWWHAVAGG